MDTTYLKSTIYLVQYSVIGYFLYHYLIKHLISLVGQIYHALPVHCVPCHPILGHLPIFFPNFPDLSGSLEATSASLYNMMIGAVNSSNLSIIWLGWVPLYVISGAGSELILNKVNLKKPPVYKLMGLKDGLIISGVEKWRGRRKMIEPYFKSKRNTFFARTMDKEVTHLPDQLGKHVGEPLDITHYLHISAINIAFEIIWGIASDQFLSVKEQLVEAIYWAGKLLIQRFFNPLYWVDSTYKLFEVGRTHLGNNEKMSSLTDKAYEACVKNGNSDKQKLRSSFDSNLNEQGDSNNNQNDSLLDFLKPNVDSGKIDTEGIKEELLTMLSAGHETTAVGIQWALFCLGHYPHYTERLYQEIMSVFSEGQSAGDLEELKKCTFLDQCVKESLRLYPPVPLVLRELQEDVYINKTKILKGSTVCVNIVGTHRDPKVYKNPDQYDPDRWSPENASKIPKGSYLPFSLGPRNCIGYRWALIEMKIYIIHIVRRFKLRSTQKPEEITQLAAISLRSACPIEIIFTDRK